MKNKFLYILFVLILLTNCFCACDKGENKIESPLIGQWRSISPSSGETKLINDLIFREDGTFSITHQLVKKDNNDLVDSQSGDGTYKINGQEVTLNYERLSGSLIIPDGITFDEYLGSMSIGDLTYDFKVTGNELELIRKDSTYIHKYIKSASDNEQPFDLNQ